MGIFKKKGHMADDLKTINNDLSEEIKHESEAIKHDTPRFVIKDNVRGEKEINTDNYPHNGKMPALLLAPYRIFGQALQRLGVLTMVILSMFAG
ncbi:MAG: hypothetical protein GY795_49565 [Desulfobacterales bacterium]|nr:hypothetical protein [Desulfobacterales bacterium]